MSDVEQKFEEWCKKNAFNVPDYTKELLRQAWMVAYFAGWDEAEKHQE